MGEILGTDLEEIGFLVQRDYGDLEQMDIIVKTQCYGSHYHRLAQKTCHGSIQNQIREYSENRGFERALVVCAVIMQWVMKSQTLILKIW